MSQIQGARILRHEAYCEYAAMVAKFQRNAEVGHFTELLNLK